MHKYSEQLLLPYPHEGWATAYPYIPKQFKFEPSDTEYLYQANLQRQPQHWYYRTHEVTYTWNSNGYRASEWADVDWSSSWVIMGCSFVAGIGLAYEDTLGEQLSRILKEPVVNLGMGGSSIDVAMYNTARLIDKNIRPKGVIIVTPNLNRMTYWKEQSYVSLIPTNPAPDNYIDGAYRGWIRYEPNAELHGYLKLRGTISMWAAEGIQPHVAYIDKTYDPTHTIGLHLPPHQDFARDVDVVNGQTQGHFGRATQASWARALAEVIQNT